MKELSEFYTVRGYQLLKQNKSRLTTASILTAAMEDYLEMIYRNSLTDGYMRINTLSELLNVSAPSVTKMVQKLTELDLIIYRKYGIIVLTDAGREMGKFLLYRHNTIETFLKNIGVANDLLVETELIEHSIFPDTLYKLSLFNRYLDNNEAEKNNMKEFIDQYSDSKKH